MKIKHPLINPEAKYYDGEDKKPAILDFERRYSVSNLTAWSCITRDKYRHPNREGKGEMEKDIVKEKTYNDYYLFLRGIVTKYPALSEVTAVTAYEALGYEMEY